MSLQVWLPLNGDTHNQGLLGNFPKGNSQSATNVFSETGKIGAHCLSYDENLTTYFANSSANNMISMFGTGKKYSVSVWMKIKDATQSITYFQFGYANETIYPTLPSTAANRTFGFFHNAKTNTMLISNGRNASIAYVSDSQIDNLEDWHHFCYTLDNGTTNMIAKIYVDGQLISSSTTPRNNDFLDLNTTNANNFICLRPKYAGFNDFRVYDHILSQKEVEELAKGLVLHYPLDNNGMGNPNLLLDSNAPSLTKINALYNRYYENGSNGTYTITWETISNPPVPGIINGIRQKVEVVTGTHQVTWYNGGFVAVETGQIYTMSCYVKVVSGTNLNFIFQYGKSPYANNTQKLINDNNWHQYSWTFTPNTSSGGAAEGGTTRIYCGGLGSVGEVLICGWKLEKGSQATPWCYSTDEPQGDYLNVSTIYDCSGYSRNGTIVGSLTAAAPSPRYDVATDFSTGSISAPHFNYCDEGNLTISFWMYSADWSVTSSSARSVVSSYTSANNNYNGLRIYRSADQTRLHFQYGATNTSTNEITYNASLFFHPDTVFDAKTWHHFAVTLDSSSGVTLVKTFCDGEPYQAITNTSLLFRYINTSNFSILAPEPNEGRISDVRIYTTVLTADQIKELYNTSMSIDASGNVYARQLSDL